LVQRKDPSKTQQTKKKIRVIDFFKKQSTDLTSDFAKTMKLKNNFCKKIIHQHAQGAVSINQTLFAPA
jgi:hypothetical protein